MVHRATWCTKPWCTCHSMLSCSGGSAGRAVPAEGGEASPPSLQGPCEFKQPFYTPLSPLDEVRRIASAPRSPPDPFGFLSDSVCSPCCGLHPCAVIWDRNWSWCLKGSAICVHFCCHLLYASLLILGLFAPFLINFGTPGYHFGHLGVQG